VTILEAKQWDADFEERFYEDCLSYRPIPSVSTPDADRRANLEDMKK
jgi:hypothetical protein